MLQDHIIAYESTFVQHQNEHAIQFQSVEELRDSLFRESQSHFDTHLQPNRINWFRTVRLNYQHRFDTDVEKRSLRAHLFQQRRDRAEDSRQLRFEWEIQQSQHTRFQGQTNALSLKLNALHSIKFRVLKKEGEEMDSFLRMLQAEIESTLTCFRGDFSDAQTGRRWKLNLRTLQGARPAATRITVASWADDVDESDDDEWTEISPPGFMGYYPSFDPQNFGISPYSHHRRKSASGYNISRLEPERTIFAPTSLFVNMFSSTTPFFKTRKNNYSPNSSLNGYKKSPDTAIELVKFLDSSTDRYNSRWREREDAFNVQQEAHKTIHNSNEQKRNQIFTAGMSEFEEMRQTQLSDWTNKVIEVKQEWSELSSKAEENRETKFKEMEIQRAEMFMKSELERSKKWEELVMTLNEAFIEANQNLDEEFFKWQSDTEQMFNKEMEKWRRSFSSLQAEFEHTFVEMVQSAKELTSRQESDS
ncbi:hypothetical protein C8Q75DRAFT_360916 [Abortiporus biennis]|nr:hypothetical protein C8Q75DRAFT_360916 [Abortiporus biennis]